MRIDPAVERELLRFPQKLDYVQKHDHIFVVFPTGKRVLVGTTRTKVKTYTLRNCVANIRRAVKECAGGHDHR